MTRALYLGAIEERVRELCRAITAEARERRDVEFVHEVASPLPTQVIGQLFGLPQQDWAHIHELAERNTSFQDPDIADGSNEAATREMAMYAIELAANRRNADRTDDLTSAILDADFGGQPMSDIEFGGFFVQLVTAGNDTTKTLISSGMHQLLLHPEQLRALRDDHSLVPGAVEEMLRFCNPVHYQRRTAVCDTTLSGTGIRAGEKVVIYYTSANRDEDQFPDAQSFDVRRTPNQHLSFGIGTHFCLGAQLARLEARVFFEELLTTFRSVELTGEPAKIRSNFINGFKRMPVHLAR